MKMRCLEKAKSAKLCSSLLTASPRNFSVQAYSISCQWKSQNFCITYYFVCYINKLCQQAGEKAKKKKYNERQREKGNLAQQTFASVN